MLRAFVNHRLTAAAEEIFGLFERTIAEYEEEMDRQRSLLRDAGGRTVCLYLTFIKVRRLIIAAAMTKISVLSLLFF